MSGEEDDKPTALAMGNISMGTTLGNANKKGSSSLSPGAKLSVNFLDPSDGSGDSEKIEQVPSNQGLGSSLGTLGTLGHLKEKKRKVSAIGKLFAKKDDDDERARRGTTINLSAQNAVQGDGKDGEAHGNYHVNKRLSMWGEQLHDKLFAKKDIKEVMRKKLKLNLKDEGNNAPQVLQTDINNIVDYDEEDQQAFVKNNFVTGFIESAVFRTFILAMIIINSIFIGLQTNRELEKKWGYVFSALDQFILTIFIFEILIKWYGGFFTFWKVGWNVFDFIIVASSLIGPSFTFVSNSRVLKILRVLRAFRSLRSISALRPLQLVVQTIIQSLPDMANILLLLIIFMFIFAVIGVSFFEDESPKYFGNLQTAMFSLFICITLDGWMEIFNSVKSEFAVAAAFFVVFILVGAFILINLVVAVVVTNLESAIAEQDELDLQQIQEEKGPDDGDNIRTFDVKEALSGKFWKHQKPIEIPNLPALNPIKVQNYMILVTALEDNYSEMFFLKEELSKIAKEVWDWNSPVEEDEETVIPTNTTAAKTERVSTGPNSGQLAQADAKRTSTFATLLSKASIASSEGDQEDKNRDSRMQKKRKSTISYTPLKVVMETKIVEEEDEGGHEGEEAPEPVVESESDEASDEDYDEEPAYAMQDLYTGLAGKERSGSRATEIEEKRAAILAEIERREKGGDVLTDLIRMNKKTKNFSGKSNTMSQFVQGVDWLNNKVKGSGEEAGPTKKKWQVEADNDKERNGSMAKLGGQRSRAGSVTSDNLIASQLSYIAQNRRMGLDDSELEELAETANTERRNSMVDMRAEMELLYSKSDKDIKEEKESGTSSQEKPNNFDSLETEPLETNRPVTPGTARRAELVPLLTGSSDALEKKLPKVEMD